MLEFRFKFHLNQAGDKQLPEPMLAQFPDAYMRY